MKKRNILNKPGHFMLNQKTETPDFDAYRVATIRNQLEEDTYFVDIQQIAAKIIDIEIALLGKE
jgi:anti-sigma28 factor (negative regulator of flagellin synthesis)